MTLIATSPAPDVAEVTRICATDHSVIRNLAITGCYARLSASMAGRLRPAALTCGAVDWCVLRQRMHDLVHLFRAYALDSALFSPPFRAEQVERFRSGVVPGGAL